MKITIIVIALFTFFSFSSIAQISRGGYPKSYKKEISDIFNDTTDLKQNDDDLNRQTIKIDVEAKKEKEKAGLAKSDCKTCNIPYYGIEIPLSINFFDKAKSKKLVDGGELWLLKLESKDWHGFQFFFENFYLPEGSELYFYNEKKDMELGAFTSLNNREDGQFITQPLLGNKVYIEYYQPLEVKEQAILKLGAVVCIFNDSFLRKGPFAREASGDCNINTACSDAFGWESEVKSVGMILEKDPSNEYWGTCSGVLINKSTPYLGTDKPLFLTANHCYETYDKSKYTSTFSNIDNWVILFRHEGLTCLDDGATISKSLTKSVTGARVLKADVHSFTSDYLLVELDHCTVDQISIYDIAFAGWSREELDAFSSKSVAIHHPLGDIKKFSYTTFQPENANGEGIGGTNALWKILWQYGVTDNGSSGSPLFNNSHQIIGQLFKGKSNCYAVWDNYGNLLEAPNLPDNYGKFSTSFTNGNFHNYLGNNISVLNSSPSKPDLNITITSSPTKVTPGSAAKFKASSSNNFGNLTCWWTVNTKVGDYDAKCDVGENNCFNAVGIETSYYNFDYQGSYRITLTAQDELGRTATKDFILNVSNISSNEYISVDFMRNNCTNTRILSTGSKVGFSDFTNPKNSGYPLYRDYYISQIDWLWFNNLINERFSFDGIYSNYVGTRSCFDLVTEGNYSIKIKAWPGNREANGSITKIEQPVTVTQEFYVIDCNRENTIIDQSDFNTYLNNINNPGYIRGGIVKLYPVGGSSLIVGTTSKINIETYNKAILLPGVKLLKGSTGIIKAYDCPKPDCDCSNWTKSAKINTITETKPAVLLDNKINIFPNPIDNYATIDLGSLINEVMRIELIDATGKLLFDQDCDFQSTNYINTQDLSPGFYFVKVSTKNGQVVKKLVKK